MQKSPKNCINNLLYLLVINVIGKFKEVQYGALFGRKIENIVELREATECSRKIGMKGASIRWTGVEMTDDAFGSLEKIFLRTSPDTQTDGGTTRRASTGASGSEMWTQVKGFGFVRGLQYPRYIESSLMMRWMKIAEIANINWR